MTTDVWAEVTAERNDLCDFLETLSPDEWDAPTLCSEWKVRDVVGHVVMGSEKLGFGKSISALAKSGFSMNKMISNTAKQLGQQPPEDLLKRLRENAASQTVPPMTKPADLLSDTLIHTQDIRRPLGRPREIPPERLQLALDDMKAVGFMGNKKRVAGLKLVATDIDWTFGEGAEVRGPAEALLLAMTGRKSVLDELTGDGVETLRNR
jgi:uncharacterized protein (TIGR03083 family)